MKKTGLADSPFFNEPAPAPSPEHKKALAEGQPVTPRDHDTTTPWYHDTVQHIRRAVKEIGKEAATHRFTPEEKRAVAEIVFRYHQQGVRTSENEITRIALNYLLQDYQAHGEQSILAQVLKQLNQ